MQQNESETKTFLFAVLSPPMLFFYAIEIFVLFGPQYLASPILAMIPKNIGFAGVIGEATDFYERAYGFALVMAASFAVTPVTVRKIFPPEERRLNDRFRENRKRVFIVLLIGPLGLIGMVFAIFVQFGDPSFCPGCTTSSRERLLTAYGVIAPFVVSYCIAAGIIATKHLLKLKNKEILK